MTKSQACPTCSELAGILLAGFLEATGLGPTDLSTGRWEASRILTALTAHRGPMADRTTPHGRLAHRRPTELRPPFLGIGRIDPDKGLTKITFATAHFARIRRRDHNDPGRKRDTLPTGICANSIEPTMSRSPVTIRYTTQRRGLNQVHVDLSLGRGGLIVLDVQSILASETGPFANHGAASMIESINALLEAAHPAMLPVLHSRYVLRDDLKDAGLLADSGMELADFCSSALLARLDPRVKVADGDVHLEHHRPSAFYASDLDAVLRRHRIDWLILCGLSVNNAISSTARDAFARDIPVVVVSEATGAAPFEDEADLAPAFRALHTWTAEVAPLESVIERIGSHESHL
jgi:nicotinamidase-related amidase